MKHSNTSLAFTLSIFVMLLGTGCGRATAEKKNSASPTEGLPSFKEGKGLSLPDETRKAIGLEIAEVSERELVPVITAELQVYRSDSRVTSVASSAPSKTALASGVVSAEAAKLLRVGAQAVVVRRGGGQEQSLDGKLIALDTQMASATGQVEALVEIPDPEGSYPVGAFFSASFVGGKEDTVTIIPRGALLTAAQGTFVYVVNGEHLFRTAVTAGAEADGFVEIKEGLYTGDKVAVKPVQALWLAELRFVKGGAACAGD